MMMNLFSTFDPSIQNLKYISWSPILILFLFMNKNTMKKSKVNLKLIYKNIMKESMNMMGKNKKMGSITTLMSILMCIMMMNLVAMAPMVFSTTAHLPISLFMSSSLWLMCILFGWYNNMKNMMIHLVPTGTPYPLMNFMVLIEMVSNLIRPITLSVRLTANMVAGHLLMSLLGNFCIMSVKVTPMISMMLILCSLEVAVAMIQAYVFMTLISLYMMEIN